jgi:hypothetical protein
LVALGAGAGVDAVDGVDEEVSLFVEDSPADFFSPSLDSLFDSLFPSPSPADVDDALFERPPA